MLTLLGVLVMLSLATAALSLTITRSKLTRGLRRRFPPGLIGDLLGCPYCMAHWIAGLLAYLAPISIGGPVVGWFIQTFAIIGLATLFTGWMQANSIWAEDEIVHLREAINGNS